MDVQSILNQTAAGTTGSSGSTGFVNKDDFMKILVAQLKNQDPLEPMKPDQFLTQLSQLTQVEQLQNISTLLQEMNSLSKAGNLAQWFSAIGKKIGVEANTLSMGDEVTILPQGEYDAVVLALKNSTDGSVEYVQFNQGDALVYRHSGQGDVSIAATALKNGEAIGCTLNVARVAKGVEIGENGIMIVTGNGDGYYLDQIMRITE